ncbi:MAG: head GIN domain-containing protein [Bacteroidota bacterium]|nr:head GIN domain-containing protein [Bacteroidota bacterium]MDP4233061.1 head GIN domain-containing protein [Bacteroidota bacterium]MDP4241794.1 head GIN domain-containing protein [Bacteroidota bacterium]MDP4288785.1 head GIN domain-containing protein [Bacteroidota bacterium]
MKFLSIATLLLILSGCGRNISTVFETYTGNGTIITDQRTPGKFQSIELEGEYEVILSQGEPSGIRIEADKNLLEHITTTVKDGKLTVSSEGNLRPTKTIRLYISTPTYSAIDLAGSGEIHATTPITSDRLSLELSGSGTYDLQVKAKDLTTTISGSGSIKLAGSAESHIGEIAGSGNLIADSLYSGTSKIDVTGSGGADVNVSRRLDASIAGSGNIHYIGGVTDVHTSIAGSGTVERAK